MNQAQWNHFSSMLRRRWLASFVVLLACVVAATYLVPFIPAYKGDAKLFIVSEALKDTTGSDPDLPSIITSTQVLDRVIKRLNLHTDSIALAKQIKTKLPLKSSIIEITYKDKERDKAVAVTNGVADEASSYFHEIATRGYTQVLAALNREIAASRLRVAEADERLQRASADSGFDSSDKALDDLTSQINDLTAQRGQINASLAADRATATGLQKQLSDISLIVRGEILQKDTAYQQVQAEIGKDAADLVSERASFRDSFPGVKALARRLESEQSQKTAIEASAITSGAGESPSYTQTVLDSERAADAVAADEQRLRATDQQLVDEQQHLRSVAGAGAHVGTLRGERDAILQQYITLTQRLSTAQGDAAQAASLGSLVVVSRAVPGKSSLPLWIAAIAILILVLAALAAYFCDVLDRRFWGVLEIERAYGRPVLLESGAKS